MSVVTGLAPGLCSHCRLPLPARPYRESVGETELEFCCFGCLTIFRILGSSGESGRASWFLAKLGLAAILSGNVMTFQSLLYFGSLESLGVDVLRTASAIMLALSIAVYLLLGVPMLRVALRAARQGRIVLETLIAIGAFAAIASSAVETIRGGHRLYYDSGTMVLVFVVLGQYLDARARQKAAQTLEVGIRSSRPKARVWRDGGETRVAPAEVGRGEHVRVLAGEEIAVDGRVLEGVSDVHAPALTGEAVPRLVRPGDIVYADSVAVDGALTIEASGEWESLAERIERWTAEARTRRARIEIAADEFVARFIPAVAIVAIASVLGWGILREQWERGWLAALSVLVVACPCALGIATPMATTIALARAAGRGTLIRSGAVIESLARVRTVAFDKTGTITRGQPEVRRVGTRDGSRVTEHEMLGLSAAVEVSVDHPFARAIVAEARARQIEFSAARETRSIPGGGAEGRVDELRLLLGSPALMEREGVSFAGMLPEGHEEESVVAVAVDGHPVGEIFLWDPPRQEASETILRLGSMDMTPLVLSGDRAEVVRNIARVVGIADARGALAPGDKARLLSESRQKQSLVAMVGDGVNDAPALAAADVGIAFGSAASLARQTADAIVLADDLREVPRLFALARKTMRIVRQNLAWAFAYNAIGILLAAFGFLRPVVAAAAMVASSLFVLGNSLRLQKHEGDF